MSSIRHLQIAHSLPDPQLRTVTPSFVVNIISLIRISELQLCQYVPSLAEAGLSHVSNKCYLSAIRHLQIAHSLTDPHISSMPKLEGVIKGIKF